MKKTKAATLYSGETKNTNIHTGIISQKCSLFKSAHEYIEHLYGYDTEGYVQILQLDNNKVLHVYNTDYNGVAGIIERIVDSKDTYITPNTFYIPRRASSNIRQLRALYLDIDLKQHSKTEAIYEIYFQVEKDKIPKPSMIVDSGRGIHLYWRIENAPMGAIYTWKKLEEYLAQQLQYLGTDTRAIDAARLLRMPGTINTRTKTICKILEINDIQYSMQELREKYLHLPISKKKREKTNQEAKIYNCFNSYNLHYSRARDLETLCQLRNYMVTGYRNSILHCYAYNIGIYLWGRGLEELRKAVYELNNKFSEPLPITEVDAIIRCVAKVIERYVYEQKGYEYKNETLIEMLDITAQEQRYLKTIIGVDEKYRRANERRTPRNAAGLTIREQNKMDTIQKVMELAKKGLKQVEIAKELGINQSSVSKILNGKY